MIKPRMRYNDDIILVLLFLYKTDLKLKDQE